MFLTRDELEQLTDRKRRSAQIRWLRARAYPFELGADGAPKVLKSLVRARCGDTGDARSTQPPEPQLRF